MPRVTTQGRYERIRPIFGRVICLDNAHERVHEQAMRDVLWLGRDPYYRSLVCRDCLRGLTELLSGRNLNWFNLDLRSWRVNSIIGQMYRHFGIRRGWFRPVVSYEDPLGW